MKTCLSFMLFAVALGASAAPAPPSLAPTKHGDFAHYTFALTWQPGFCASHDACSADQAKDVLIGLHGLWASRPQDLIRRGIQAPQWWRRGCDFYHHSDRPPVLSAATRRALDRLMPQLHPSLLRHEYDKHVQCFGFASEPFFRTELELRMRVVDSGFGRYLTGQARGHRVARRQVTDAFMRAFGTPHRRALQLRCDRDRQGRTVLTQMWITFHADAIADFPGPRALMDAPIAQANCPDRFLVPDWAVRQRQR